MSPRSRWGSPSSAACSGRSSWPCCGRRCPPLDALTDYQPKIPLRVVSADGDLLGEFGEERRAIVRIGEVPDVMKQAILAAEDERFYQHGGVDYLSVLRAALANATSGTQQGAGTITMQVARNFFLTREKTVSRKLREVLLAWKIEANLSKDEILELYVNQIFLGQRAYGFAAAAQIYFGKPLAETHRRRGGDARGPAQGAVRLQPDQQSRGARRPASCTCCDGCTSFTIIDDDQFREAQNAPLVRAAADCAKRSSVHAEFVAEMARQVVFDAYGDDAYTRGITVWTTIRRADQEAAYAALRKGVIDYDQRPRLPRPGQLREPAAGPGRAGRGARPRVPGEPGQRQHPARPSCCRRRPRRYAPCLRNGDQVRSDGRRDSSSRSARSPTRQPANQKIRRGAIIRLLRDDKGALWRSRRCRRPRPRSSPCRPDDGAILALVGGFDYDAQQVQPRHAGAAPAGLGVQAVHLLGGAREGLHAGDDHQRRAVLRAGRQGRRRGAGSRRTTTASSTGPMRLRVALAKSKNLVTIRVLQAIGPQYAQDYIARFGFDPKLHPAYLTMGLGAGAATPLQMATAYSVFANGGYRDRAVPHRARSPTASGNVAVRGEARARRRKDAERAIDPRNAFIMTTLLRDVIASGTAARALELKRKDLAGKTGTTNDNVDAWFCGFNAAQVGVAWIGFDQPKTLGTNETGGVAALPIWISYMQRALKGVPEELPEPPAGVVSLRINPDTGLRDDSSKLVRLVHGGIHAADGAGRARAGADAGDCPRARRPRSDVLIRRHGPSIECVRRTRASSRIPATATRRTAPASRTSPRG